METFIAGADSSEHDQSDWDIDEIPVYFNPAGMPETTTLEQVEKIIRQCCFSWSLRYSHNLVYKGQHNSSTRPDSIVLNYGDSAKLAQFTDKLVNGLCRYHTKYHNGEKWILSCAELYMNSDNRPLANGPALDTAMHEFGHACGIHGHVDDVGSVMYGRGTRTHVLSLLDLQALDSWNPYPVELHADLSLTCPAVQMPDGKVKWLNLKYTGNQFYHTWDLSDEIPWDGPKMDNVTIGGTKEFGQRMCQIVQMKHVQSPEMKVRADMLFAPNGNLILEFAE